MRVLISHDARNESQFAQTLADSLRAVGVEPRIENLKAVCGHDTRKLQKELRTRYNYVVPVLSPSYMHDSFLVTELLEALMIEQTAKSSYVVPTIVADCYVLPLLQDRLVDFRSVSFEDGFKVLNSHISDKRQVFVVMKFGDADLDSAYELAIKPTVQRFGFSALRIDEVQDSGSITEQVLSELDSSAAVLADLTGERPNCYLEVGYALALEKELILSVRKGHTVHFDLADRRFIEWGTPKELQDALIPRLSSIKERASRQQPSSSTKQEIPNSSLHSGQNHRSPTSISNQRKHGPGRKPG